MYKFENEVEQSRNFIVGIVGIALLAHGWGQIYVESALSLKPERFFRLNGPLFTCSAATVCFLFLIWKGRTTGKWVGCLGMILSLVGVAVSW